MVKQNKKKDINSKDISPEVLKKMNKYNRGQSGEIRSISDKKVKGNMKKFERKNKEAAFKSVQSELLLTEEAGYLEAEGMEKTYKFTQEQIKENVDLSTQAKMFNLELDTLGPYTFDYTRNGRDMLIAGKKGHISTFNWKNGKLGCELFLNETVRDAKWLHNETMFAVAQKKYTYIYDSTGMELHCLRKHTEVNKLEFLPYHFLLVTIGNAGWLKYQDTSTGNRVAEFNTKLGRCDCMVQNPYNGIINLGHSNGTVTLWSPSMSSPLVKMLCHKAPIQSIAIDNGGYYMATAGLDSRVKIWDLRTYKELQNYLSPTPASSLSISQKGLLAVGFGPHVNIWKDAFKEKQKSPYMSHLQPSCSIKTVKFCPFEDILGLGHDKGFSSIVIPGSGEPNFDSLEANPYETVKQRREKEVHDLLEKLQPETIALNPNFIGSVDRASKEIIEEEKKLEWEAAHPNEKFQPRKRTRGKSSSLRRYLRKQTHVIDEKKEKLKKELQKLEDEKKRKALGITEDHKPSALDRFSKKPRI